MPALVSSVSVFHGFLAIKGWFLTPNDPLVSVTLRGGNALSLKCVIAPQRVDAAGQPDGHYHFDFHGYLMDCAPQDAEVVFQSALGRVHVSTIAGLVQARRLTLGSNDLNARFQAAVRNKPGAMLLDVGGRARSGLDRSSHFQQARTTVFDINPGDNVDVIGDAHKISQHLLAASYDFVQSISVFEHLARPWVVIAEINKVMKVGGLLFISSHQTIGMHDVPWDFWRFSDQAYRALLNEETGFEVLAAEMHEPANIVPHLYDHALHEGGEKAAGFMSSTVLAVKTRDCAHAFNAANAAPPDVMKTPYPA